MAVSALVLAAGGSRRFGGQKLLAPLKGKAVIMHCLDAALDSRLSEIILVTTGVVLSGLELNPAVKVAINTDPSKGMSHSIGIGLNHVSETSDSAIIMLGDMPDITSGHIDKIIEMHNLYPDRVIASLSGSTVTPPVLFPRTLFGKLEKLRGDHGARDIITGSADAVTVELDSGMEFDIDTREDLERSGI